MPEVGADTLVALAEDLAARGMRLAIAGALPQARVMLERSGALDRLGADAMFGSLREAVEMHESRDVG